MLRRIARYLWATSVYLAVWEGAKVLIHVLSLPAALLAFVPAVIIAAVAVGVRKVRRSCGEPVPAVRLQRSATSWLPEYGNDGDCDLVLVSPGNRKILIIKEIRTLTGMGLKEAKDLIDNAPVLVLRQVTSERADAAKELLGTAGRDRHRQQRSWSGIRPPRPASRRDRFSASVPGRCAVCGIDRTPNTEHRTAAIIGIVDSVALVIDALSSWGF